MNIVRSDRLALKADTAPQREALRATLAIYRALVRDLMGVVIAHWHTLGAHSDNAIVAPIEALIHPTAKRRVVRYGYFAKRYYKFPSYLRRAAIMDAAGQVRSFMTRYDAWQIGERKHPNARPPRLTCATGTFPSLYSGQCIQFDADMRSCRIKVRHHNDWVWMDFKLQGKPRYMPKGTIRSPSLTVRGARWFLSVPVTTTVTLPEPAHVECVLSVDVGINTAATWAVVDATGTVHDRGFLDRSDKDRSHRIMARIRSAAVTHTRHGCRLPSGFAAADHRRLRQLSNNQAHQISRQLVNTAQEHGCQAVIVENLKGWRPKAGRRRSTMKQRFHRWFHRQLVGCIESKATEAGLRCQAIHARGTSRQAFDGSGPVRRDAGNASLCSFATGKRYNADLNAAYNIAARGLVHFRRRRKATAGGRRPKSGATPGNPVTLSTLWAAQPTTR
ncbi:IS200/IS605 family accessory protein TnpB-related protein [Salinisphaera sp. LB1]|uniref:IS200/IS605 family accessory protein TnpB-related protein n=1 Tax=Salinisphaera sp. LB1 TaxID=2183911 RepID=UPI000D7E1532|nr:IS200/IS605 family accessory protein TnpB-related protein [Salinisphaera sp. LB1]AWN17629.1 Transposase [Salinisphaera sp. LB1]